MVSQNIYIIFLLTQYYSHLILPPFLCKKRSETLPVCSSRSLWSLKLFGVCHVLRSTLKFGGLKSTNTSPLFPPVKGPHHPISQMWKLRRRRAKASPLWSQYTNSKHVTSPHHFQRCQGLPGPFAVTYTGPLMDRHPLYASTSTLPLKLDQSAWFRLRSRPFSPALMAAPRVSNYNKEGRSQDSLAISQDQISFNSF